MKTVRLFFSSNILHEEIANLTEKGKVLIEDMKRAESFNNYFSNVVCPTEWKKSPLYQIYSVFHLRFLQHCLTTMIEICCQSLNAGGHAGALLTDLPITFDYINFDLLNAKLQGS